SIYIVLTTLLIIYVANYLFKNGKSFLLSAFKGNESVANSINNLLKMGFYLVNIGYALISIRYNYNLQSNAQLIEALAVKIGTIVLILGAMHFFNMYILYLIGRITRDKEMRRKETQDTYVI
ncbi:hypothetical protein N8289_00665, partial [Flavobacteriales bacterium]|nr:hypothetical protein [Flavobacteriales bacterium]